MQSLHEAYATFPTLQRRMELYWQLSHTEKKKADVKWDGKRVIFILAWHNVIPSTYGIILGFSSEKIFAVECHTHCLMRNLAPVPSAQSWLTFRPKTKWNSNATSRFFFFFFFGTFHSDIISQTSESNAWTAGSEAEWARKDCLTVPRWCGFQTWNNFCFEPFSRLNWTSKHDFLYYAHTARSKRSRSFIVFVWFSYLGEVERQMRTHGWYQAAGWQSGKTFFQAESTECNKGNDSQQIPAAEAETYATVWMASTVELVDSTGRQCEAQLGYYQSTTRQLHENKKGSRTTKLSSSAPSVILNERKVLTSAHLQKRSLRRQEQG